MAFGFGFGMPRSFAVPPFSPASLFANGEQGWWYDPSNMPTLFQDSAGTTPVTAMEQPVGLQLDLSKGLVLGTERVTNGVFSSATGWTLGDASVLISSGQLSFNSTPNAISATGTGATSAPTVGMPLQANINITSFTAGGVRVSYGGVVIATFTSAGQKSVVFFATNTNNIPIVQAIGTTTATVDNFSIKELPGNHRFQTTSANRPVVSARVNLLTKTEEFDNAVWTKSNVTVTANSAVAPDETTTADKLVETTASGLHRFFVGFTPASAATPYTYSLSIKADTRTKFRLEAGGSGFNAASADFDLVAGTATAGGSIVSQGNGWYRCSITAVSASTASALVFGYLLDAAGISNYTGDGTSGIYIWGADLRPTNQGVNLPAYQRVNTSTDYDSTGFPIYIKPNGSNQFMQTNSINFSATDKMTVWQGVRKLSDAAQAIAFELSTTAGVNNGTFQLSAPSSSVNDFNWLSRGTTIRSVSALSLAPATAVITGVGDISGDVCTLRVNRTQAGTNTGDQGTGNYGNYPAYFYMRGGTSLPFNGNDYGSIARGAASTAAQITAGENYINSKTKAFA